MGPVKAAESVRARGAGHGWHPMSDAELVKTMAVEIDKYRPAR